MDALSSGGRMDANGGEWMDALCRGVWMDALS